MQQVLTADEASGFIEEQRANGPTMLRVAALLPLASFVGLAPIDPLISEGSDLRWALITRAVACACFLGLFAATFVKGWASRWVRPASIGACLMTGLTVIVLTYLTGGSHSDYHEALHATMFGFATLPVPWRRWDATVQFVLLVLAYNLVLVLGDRAGVFGVLASHNALLAASATLAAILQGILMRGRRRDYLSRQALADANERLTALDTAKTRFFSNISHELRTPLTLIVAPLEAMLESAREPLSVGQRERLRLAQRNALRLLRLVDDLLSLTRAEAASLKLHVKKIDLGELVTAFAQDVTELAARKQLTVAVDVPETPAIVEADATLLERILLNVFGNAAKFVDRGGHITLAVRRSFDGAAGYELTVSDDGIGISEENLPRIFDRFYQADSGTTRSTGGTGIGLALVKEITELHGGRVSAQSALGRGTTMRCWFPEVLPAAAETHVVRAQEAAAEPQGLPEWHQAIRSAKSYRLQGIDDATERRVAPRPRHRGDAPTILVVEDNPDMIRFLVAIMAYDFNVLAAQNGVDGLRMALERRPDLIISDVMMPEMDGFEMVRRLRQDPNGAKIPLIFLTARGGVEDRIQGHSGGADTYLAKPFRSEELLAAVDSLLARQQRIRESATTHQDEALVYLASGMLEHVQRSLAALESLQGLLAGSRSDDAELVTRYAENLARLAALVTGLRELTEVGSIPVLHPAPIDDALRSIAAGAVETMPKGRSLHVELQAPSHVRLTEEELRAVVGPLLERAIEVTPVGRNVFLQTLHHRPMQGGASHSPTVSIVIRDEGPALTPSQIERLFFPFHNLDVEVRTALELARARRIVLARGGTIGVEPEPELGTRITIHLPLLDVIATEAAA